MQWQRLISTLAVIKSRRNNWRDEGNIMDKQKKALLMARIGLSISFISGVFSVIGGVQMLQVIQESILSMQIDKDLAYFAIATGSFICLCSLIAAVLIQVGNRGRICLI